MLGQHHRLIAESESPLDPGMIHHVEGLAAWRRRTLEEQWLAQGGDDSPMAEGFWAGVPVIATRSGLAKVIPGLVREVGFVPSGTELADAILADHDWDISGRRDRVARAGSFAQERLDLARFGAEWTLLVQVLNQRANSTDREEDRCRLTVEVA